MRTRPSRRSALETLTAVVTLFVAVLVPVAPAGAQADPPTITVEPRFDHIAAHSFAPNTTLTFKAFEDETATTEVLSETVGSDESGFAEFNAEGVADLEPGMLVRVTDGTTTKDLVIHDLVIDKVNPDNETVTGSLTAADGTQVDVGIFPEELNQTATVTGNAWSTTFTSIEWTSVADASVPDGDGDRTSVKKEPPRLDAFPQWSMINGSGFLGGATVTFSVTDGGVEQIPTNNTRTADAYGDVEFNLPEACCGGFDVFPKLRPGMVVSASDGTTTKSLVVSNLSIDRVDLELNRVTGSADPGQSVSVGLFDPTIEVPPSVVVADSTGRWQVDFADITTSSKIHSRIVDAEADATGRDFNPPQIQASQDPNWWGGLQLRIGEFNPGTLMTLTILGSGGETLLSNTYNLEDGRFERNFGHLDALPGMVVRATDGVYTKELTIEPLTIDNPDPTGDMVHGTATEGAVVSVHTESGQAQAETQPDGTWTADFSSAGFTIDTEVFASITDPDGDNVVAERFPRIIGISPTDGHLSADGFAANSPITFEVFNQPEADGGTRLNPSEGPVMSDEIGRAELNTAVALSGGMEVAISDGFGERRGVLADITIDSVNPTLDTASGTAPAGTELAAGSLCGLTEQGVTADGSGNWSLVGYIFDIIHTVQACSPSPTPGVDTRWRLSTPIVSVEPVTDLIVADGFDPSGGDITFEIYSGPGGALLHSEAVAQQDFTNENGVTFNGHAELPRTAHGVDLVAGMLVRATQGTTVKEHEVAPLTVDVADPVTSDVSGTAAVPAGGELIVALDLQFVLRPEVDGSGNWVITEADRTFDCGEAEPCLWQLEHEAVVQASVVDPDGDRTLVLQGAAEQVTCNAATSCTTDESPPDGSTDLDPVETTVTTPTAGAIHIAEEQLTRQAPDTFAFLGQQVDIDAPNATAANPLQIVLRLDATRIPKGKTATDLQIYRNGEYVPDCAADSGGTASPDPCVSAREKLSDGDAQLTIRSSQASDWNAGASTDARPPTLESASFSVNPKTRSQTTVLSATGSDELSGVGGGEFFIGGDPGEGDGTAMALSGSTLEGTIGTLDPGTYEVGVRVRDKAGNWSSVTTLSLVVEPDPSGGGGGGGGGPAPSPSPSVSPSPSPSVSESPSPSPSPSESPPPIDPSCDEPGVICGTDGDDLLTGTDGPDVIIGGDGNDTIIGRDGDDVCLGNKGDDTIDCGRGNDVIRGRAGDDDLKSTGGDDDIRGHAGSDSISGGAGSDVLRGGRGADVILGRSGPDRLVGGPGRDRLNGGAGDDVIVGGTGRDVMRGGAGDDRFQARDFYTDRVNGGRGQDFARRDEFDVVLSVP